MRANTKGAKHVPIFYRGGGENAAEVVSKIIREWNRKTIGRKNEKTKPTIPPTICFSRQIGTGVSEIAGILADKTGYRVIDREIIEYLSKNEELSGTTTGFFNERYPGLISEYLSMIFDEKAFVKSDNIRRLFSAILYFAYSGPSIIIGRGAFLLLPRERVMAVRFLCGRENRIKRLSKLLNVEAREIEQNLDLIDKEQENFFRHVYGKKGFSPQEFDMIINYDAVDNPERVADIIYDFFQMKFGAEVAVR